MITTESPFVCIHMIGSSGCGAVITREAGEEWMRTALAPLNNPAGWTLLPVPICLCCGAPADQDTLPAPRCAKHRQSHACVIEGCRRSRSTKHVPTTEDYFCGEHWRLYCPPRSLRRRTYHAFWRRAKKLGLAPSDPWPPRLERQFWRFWETLVRNARAKAAGGSLDEAAINRMFGWDEPGG